VMPSLDEARPRPVSDARSLCRLRKRQLCHPRPEPSWQ
jgi:hypothetical protein